MLIFIGHFPQKSSEISGSFAERDEELQASYLGHPVPPKNGLIALQTPRTSRFSTFYYCQVVNRALLRLLSTHVLV